MLPAPACAAERLEAVVDTYGWTACHRVVDQAANVAVTGDVMEANCL